MTKKLEIGARIRTAREAQKITQDRLGELLGVHGQTVQHWEHGRSTPNIELWPALARALNVKEEWILTGREAWNPERQRHHALVDQLPERHVAQAELYLMAMVRDPGQPDTDRTTAQPPFSKR